MIDLHAHTTASDGTSTPRELVGLAASRKIDVLAVTDHDTIAGLAEARAAGNKLGIEVIAGVEFSTEYSPGTMHLLGYGFALDDPTLLATLEAQRRRRDERNPRIAEKLRSLGLDIDIAEVTAAAGGDVIGRPHFGQVLMKKGYVASLNEAFSRYLDRGAPGYVSSPRIAPADAIAAVRRAGGVAVLAHPYQLRAPDDAALEQIVIELKAAGLGGIEVYYSRHRPEQVQFYRQLAERYDLLVSGGSDFHGTNKPDISLGTGCGDLHVPEELLAPLKAAFQQLAK